MYIISHSVVTSGRSSALSRLASKGLIKERMRGLYYSENQLLKHENERIFSKSRGDSAPIANSDTGNPAAWFSPSVPTTCQQNIAVLRT